MENASLEHILHPKGQPVYERRGCGNEWQDGLQVLWPGPQEALCHTPLMLGNPGNPLPRPEVIPCS